MYSAAGKPVFRSKTIAYLRLDLLSHMEVDRTVSPTDLYGRKLDVFIDQS